MRVNKRITHVSLSILVTLSITLLFFTFLHDHERQEREGFTRFLQTVKQEEPLLETKETVNTGKQPRTKPKVEMLGGWDDNQIRKLNVDKLKRLRGSLKADEEKEIGSLGEEKLGAWNDNQIRKLKKEKIQGLKRDETMQIESSGEEKPGAWNDNQIRRLKEDKIRSWSEEQIGPINERKEGVKLDEKLGSWSENQFGLRNDAKTMKRRTRYRLRN
jgi:hypothetical protein